MHSFDATIERRTREINGELTQKRPGAEADEYEQEKNRENAEEAIDKEEPIAEAPEHISLGKAKEAEGQDGAERDEDENVEGEEDAMAREIKQ